MRFFTLNRSIAKQRLKTLGSPIALLSTALLFATGVQAAINKPLVGDSAPQFDEVTLDAQPAALTQLVSTLPAGQSLHLVFLDALCPFPHFPDCEAKLQQLNLRVSQDSSAHWLGIVNSYYVTEELVRGFAAENKLTLPLVFDTDNSVVADYGVFATPYRVTINGDGEITYRGEALP